MKRNNRATVRNFSRLDRVNELLREILGDELERLDLSELVFVTVTGVDCSADLRHATVYFDGPGGGANDEATIEALEEVRRRLQHAIGRQARLKHTPELTFAPDPAVRAGEHIEAVLRTVEGADSGGTDQGESDDIDVGPLR